MRWKFVALKWFLEFFLQGGTSNFSIFLVFFSPVIDLCDEIIIFHEDCHNRNCICSAIMKGLEILKPSYHSRHVAHWRTSVPIPITGEIHLERNKTWAYCQLPVHHVKVWSNTPYCMDLVLYFIRFRLLLYERQYIPKFLLPSCLETRRVVEDKLWVALEWKLIMDIVDPSLQHQSQGLD